MWIAITTGLLFLALTLGLQWRLQRLRRKRFTQFELRPNCLLTRHPIIFVASRRSLFRVFDPWNDIPAFLREHGYEVFVLEPQFTRLFSRMPSVRDQIRDALGLLARSSTNSLARSSTNSLARSSADSLARSSTDSLARSSTGPLSKFHLIAESSMEADWIRLANDGDNRIASLTLAVRQQGKPKRIAEIREPVDRLKPLASSIEELSFDEFAPLLRECRGWSRIAIWLVAAHNSLTRFGRARPGAVDPIAVGQVLTSDWAVESHFLERAIELAERDARFSST